MYKTVASTTCNVCFSSIILIHVTKQTVITLCSLPSLLSEKFRYLYRAFA
jgi:hypothetical protein